MKTCVVNLVGDQTIPNILITMHFEPNFLLLITTAAMERKGKSQAILETLKMCGFDYTERHQKIEVQENSIIDLQEKVGNWLSQIKDEYQFTVNLTGGTKLMSIAAYDLFTDFGSEMVYVPIPKNEFIRPFPKRRPREAVRLNGCLGVAEDLSAYSFGIVNPKNLDSSKKLAYSRKQVTLFLYDNYRELKPMLSFLWRTLKSFEKAARRGCDYYGDFTAKNELQAKALDMLDFECKGGEIVKRIDKADVQYLRGGWLEERVFLALDEALPSQADVLLNVVIKDPQKNQNEFDTLFTLDNALSIVECKSLGAAEGSAEDVGANITGFLYKLGALRQRFGLTPEAILATTSEDVLDEKGAIKAHLIERANQFRTRIVSLLQVPDLEEYFRSTFRTSHG